MLFTTFCACHQSIISLIDRSLITNMPTDNILSKTTINAHDKPPKFSNEQRDASFLVLPSLRRRLSNMEPSRKLRHVLDYGYFSARQQFYDPKHFPIKDVRHVRSMLSIPKHTDPSDVSVSSL